MSWYCFSPSGESNIFTYCKLSCVWSFTGAGCCMGDTSPTKVSMEIRPLHLCPRELRELLLLRSIHMQPMAPGFRYLCTHTHRLILKLKGSMFRFPFQCRYLTLCSSCIDIVDWRVCGANAWGFTGTKHSWGGKWNPCILTFVWFCSTACMFHHVCSFSLYRQSYQRSIAGLKRSWRSLYYQTLCLIIRCNEKETLNH